MFPETKPQPDWLVAPRESPVDLARGKKEIIRLLPGTEQSQRRDFMYDANKNVQKQNGARQRNPLRGARQFLASGHGQDPVIGRRLSKFGRAGLNAIVRLARAH